MMFYENADVAVKTISAYFIGEKNRWKNHTMFTKIIYLFLIFDGFSEYGLYIFIVETTARAKAF